MNELLNENLSQMEQSPYYWSQVYPIAYYEMDFNRVLKPSALMNFIQDMATKNAEMLGFGPSFIFANNFAWFLIKYRMEFDEYPCELDELLIKTEARGYTKLIANRDFEIWTADNKKRLAKIASNWMLIDLNSKRPVNLSKTISFMPVYQKREDDLEFNKISLSEINSYEKSYEIRFDDIDVNKHVNNANYIVWAFEALPYDFKSSYRLKTLDVIYKKEIAFGHKILSQAEINFADMTSVHVLKNALTQEELCLIQAEWS